MKKIIKSTLILLAVFAVSCSDFLKEDPRTQLSSDKTFASAQALKLLAAGLYEPYNYAYVSNPDNIFLMCMPADDITSDRSEWQFEQSDLFTQSDMAERLVNGRTWERPFQGIATANEIINGYEAVPAESDADKTLVDNIVGQAYFHRAHWLLFMSKFWGAIPMPLVNDGAILKKSSVDKIFDQAIADLLMAEELLPNSHNEANWITSNGFSMTPLKFAAQAWLAQAYLQSTGWPLKRTENYAKAAEKAKAVMEFSKANRDVLGLMPMDQLWAGLGPWHKEFVWGYVCRDPGAFTMRCSLGETPHEELVSGTGWATNMAELFFYSEFPEGKRKDITFRTTIWVEPNTPALQADLKALQATLSKELLPQKRFGADWPVRRWNQQTNKGKNLTVPVCAYSWQNFNPDTDLAAGKFFWDERWSRWNVQVTWDDFIKNPASRRHPYYAKSYFDNTCEHTYIPLTGPRTPNPDGTIPAWGWETRSMDAENWGTGRSQPWMRYAEVLLIYAEAQAMANGVVDQTCIDALNELRSRADETRGLASLSDYASAADFQKAIFNERGWEFAGMEYGQRWADLLRFERAKEMNTHRTTLEPWPDGRAKEKTINPDFYANEKKYYYLLIPGTEKAKTGYRDNDASIDPINPQE